MRGFKRLASTLSFIALLAAAPHLGARAENFTHPVVARDVTSLEQHIKAHSTNAATQRTRPSVAQQRVSGLKLFAEARDPRGATQALMDVVASEPKDAAAWHALAKAFLAITPDTAQGEQYTLPAHAVAAAFRAYERAPTPPTRHPHSSPCPKDCVAALCGARRSTACARASR